MSFLSGKSLRGPSLGSTSRQGEISPNLGSRHGADGGASLARAHRVSAGLKPTSAPRLCQRHRPQWLSAPAGLARVCPDAVASICPQQTALPQAGFRGLLRPLPPHSSPLVFQVPPGFSCILTLSYHEDEFVKFWKHYGGILNQINCIKFIDWFRKTEIFRCLTFTP